MFDAEPRPSLVPNLNSSEKAQAHKHQSSKEDRRVKEDTAGITSMSEASPLNIEFNLTAKPEENLKTPAALIPPKSISLDIFHAITAPAVLSGMGNSLIVASQSMVSYVVMAALTAITAGNELASRTNVTDAAKAEAADQSNTPSLHSFLARKVSSPGLCSELQGYTYVATALVSLHQGHPVVAGSFALFSVGSWAGAAIANRDKLTNDYAPIRIERLAKNIWNKIPERGRIVLRDPAASFAIANIPIFGQTLVSSLMNGTQESLSPIILVGVTVGALLAVAASVSGVRPLFSSQQPEASGRASVINGLSNLVLGGCMVWGASLAGQVAGFYTGSAAILWAFANFGFAARIEQGRTHQ